MEPQPSGGGGGAAVNLWYQELGSMMKATHWSQPDMKPTSRLGIVDRAVLHS